MQPARRHRGSGSKARRKQKTPRMDRNAATGTFGPSPKGTAQDRHPDPKRASNDTRPSPRALRSDSNAFCRLGDGLCAFTAQCVRGKARARTRVRQSYQNPTVTRPRTANPRQRSPHPGRSDNASKGPQYGRKTPWRRYATERPARYRHAPDNAAPTPGYDNGARTGPVIKRKSARHSVRRWCFPATRRPPGLTWPVRRPRTPVPAGSPGRRWRSTP